MSKIVSYSFRTISKWETGESIPDYDNLVVLSKFFNVSVDDLMEKDLSCVKDLQRYSSKLIDNKS
ncbi:MAG: helix-turn-helix transcriptional regulator, partial [Candidatus Enterosoma sp.]|nr:helix-turn-helix transcriptional regulator [Candidatus Enterosoma sp.]